MMEYIISDSVYNSITKFGCVPVEGELIRCRDCKCMDEIQPETNQPCSTDPDGFCSWAVRK